MASSDAYTSQETRSAVKRDLPTAISALFPGQMSAQQHMAVLRAHAGKRTKLPPDLVEGIRELPLFQLGALYEQLQAIAQRKAKGIYYTPAALVERVIAHALLDAAPLEKILVIDPACGTGNFLLAAYRVLCERFKKHWLVHDTERIHPSGNLRLSERRRILREHLMGVDLDPHATLVTRYVLAAGVGGGSGRALKGNVLAGDALFDIPWKARADGRAVVVIGNPPWGSKAPQLTKEYRTQLAGCYPTSAGGTFDLFRAFVELAVTLMHYGYGTGRFALLLPDTVLLKNCEATRRHLLDHTYLSYLEHLRAPFPDVTMDAAIVAGHAAIYPADNWRAVCVTPEGRQRIPSSDFEKNPRCAFNLYMTPARRKLLDSYAKLPRLGDYFQVREGAHTGNMRAALLSDSEEPGGKPFVLRGKEVTPFSCKWAGTWIRADLQPTGSQYRNLGATNYSKTKVLVRRTGDRVIAAVDRAGHYCSNNFFTIQPLRGKRYGLTPEGLCSFLNSPTITELFRIIEPRVGAAFAELKIRHIADFPLPEDASYWNVLGAKSETSVWAL